VKTSCPAAENITETPDTVSHRASRAAHSEKLFGLLPDGAQTLSSNRTFNPKQLYHFCFFILCYLFLAGK